MEQQITENTVCQFIEEVANQHHAMAGAVIAASAAQATAFRYCSIGGTGYGFG
jgi:hypothetical protein